LEERVTAASESKIEFENDASGVGDRLTPIESSLGFTPQPPSLDLREAKSGRQGVQDPKKRTERTNKSKIVEIEGADGKTQLSVAQCHGTGYSRPVSPTGFEGGRFKATSKLARSQSRAKLYAQPKPPVGDRSNRPQTARERLNERKAAALAKKNGGGKGVRGRRGSVTERATACHPVDSNVVIKKVP